MKNDQNTTPIEKVKKIAIVTYYPISSVIETSRLIPGMHEVYLYLCEDSYQQSISFIRKNEVFIKKCEVYVDENFMSNGNVDWDIVKDHGQFCFDNIITFDEDNLLRVAYLREKLGIKGQSVESAVAYRDKVIMKDYISKNSEIFIPRYKKITTAIDILNFIEEHGFPVFVKPVNASGSVDAKCIKNENDLKGFLKNGLSSRILFAEYPGDMEVEQYIEGQLYHVDGFVVDNELILCHPSKYLSNNLELSLLEQKDYIGSVLLSTNHRLYERLVDISKKVLSALPSPDTFSFHIEFFHTNDDKLFFCEASSRAGGGLIVQMVESSFGFNLNINYFLLMLDKELYVNLKSHTYCRPSHLSGFALVNAGRVAGIIKTLPTACSLEFVDFYELHCKIGSQVGNRIHSAQRIASFLVSGATENMVKNNLDKTVHWFFNNTVIDVAGE